MAKTTLRHAPMGLTLAGLTFLSTSYRKDLCYGHGGYGLSVKVNLSSDWEQEWECAYTYGWEELWEGDWKHDYDDLRSASVDGIHVQVYTSDGQHMGSNLSDEGGWVTIPEDMHELLFYSSDTEYIVFDGVAASKSAIATTRGVTRSSCRGLHAGERTVNQPDILYGAYMEEYMAEKTLVPTKLPVTLCSLIYTYIIRYELESRQQYVVLARGTLAGVVETAYLNDGHTGEDAVAVPFDCILEDYGAEALVQSFGVPDYPGRHYE